MAFTHNHTSTTALAAQKLLFHGDNGVFYHSFACEVDFSEETTLSVCEGSIPSSITLNKEGQVRRQSPTPASFTLADYDLS